MATFPAIEPLERSYDLGAHPVSSVTFANGDQARFLHGEQALGVPMPLVFRGLNLAKVQLIRAHFKGQGLAKPFRIPPDLWRTHVSTDDVVPASFAWQYAAPPEETPYSGGLFDVSITLISAA